MPRIFSLRNVSATYLLAMALGLVLALCLAPSCAMADESDSADTQTMYRLYNPNSGEHFYTASSDERSTLAKAGWRYEGVGWVAPTTSSTPVYRLYNPNPGPNGSGEHHYTMSTSERDNLVKAGWKDEGIGWYSDDAKSVPVYRQYNPNAYNCNHNYTTSTDERDYLLSLGWKDESIGWYAVSGPSTEGKVLSYSQAGALHVEGTRLVSEKGDIVQLRGVSTHGLAWYPQYVNADAFATLRGDWGANVVRLAMYTGEYGGYCNGGDRSQLEALIDAGVQAATANDMYVIIDWHVLNDWSGGSFDFHQSDAVDFFARMSAKYAGQSNVIYEVCNEPQSSPFASVIKPYAQSVLAAIRANDPDAIVVVGTNTWSQDVDEVAGNRIDDDNVVYALHFYAGTHKDSIRAKLASALSAGVPVLVSECSITDASGSGAIDYDSASTWLDLLNSNDVGFVCWSLSNKGETSALISSSCSKTSGWSDSELSEAGRWWKAAISAASY